MNQLHAQIESTDLTFLRKIIPHLYSYNVLAIFKSFSEFFDI